MAANITYPIGFKFLPSDQELILYYLSGCVAPSHNCIVEKDIYLTEPHSFNWDHVSYLNDYERYYLVKRSQVAKSSGGKNVNRTVESGVGVWKMSYSRDIKDAQNNIIGHCSSLNYHRYIQGSDKNEGKKSEKTHFLMHEYTVATDEFQEWVISRVKDQDKEKAVRERKRKPNGIVEPLTTRDPYRDQTLESEQPAMKRLKHADDNQTSLALRPQEPPLAPPDIHQSQPHQLDQTQNDDEKYYAKMLEDLLVTNSAEYPQKPEAEISQPPQHQMDQSENNDDIDWDSLGVIDQKAPQISFQSLVPIDDDGQFEFINDLECDIKPLQSFDDLLF